MSIRINTNIASLQAQRNLQSITSRLHRNYARLSSGLRIATAADDPAGLGISEKMRSKIRSYSVASRNTLDGISLLQTAEGALSEVSNLLGRMRELAVQASNGTLSTVDRATLDAEFQEIDLEIDRIANDTEFNDVPLLNVSGTISLLVGIDASNTFGIDTVDSTSRQLGVDTLDVLTASNGSSALDDIDLAIQTVAQTRGSFGAAQNVLTSRVASLDNARTNLAAAESRIRDVDVAFESAELAKNSILQQAAIAVLTQANAQPQLALTLLEF